MMEIVESRASVANYAVTSRYIGQIAWFVVEEDAEEFIRLQTNATDYEVQELL